MKTYGGSVPREKRRLASGQSRLRKEKEGREGRGKVNDHPKERGREGGRRTNDRVDHSVGSSGEEGDGGEGSEGKHL